MPTEARPRPSIVRTFSSRFQHLRRSALTSARNGCLGSRTLARNGASRYAQQQPFSPPKLLTYSGRKSTLNIRPYSTYSCVDCVSKFAQNTTRYLTARYYVQCFCSLTRPNVSSDPEYEGCVDVCAGSTDGEICGGSCSI